MNTQDYWKRRTLEREQLWNDLIDRDLDRIIKFYYEQSLLKIQKDIAALYAQFAVENKLSMSEAKRLIRGSEFSQWRMTLQEYVKAAKNDSDILKELNTLAMRSRISRIEALHARTMMEVADLCEKMNQWENSFQYRAYIEHLYGNLYDYHKTIGLNTPPVAVDKKHVENILTTPWIGDNYSKRIWKNGRKLERAIQTTMIHAIHRGYSIQKLSKDLSERMKVSYHNAERLVRTELNYIENRAAFDAMKDADLEYYQFVATLDNRTTPMCQSLDGRVFPLEEKNQGENAPPMHVRCRSTIIGSLDDGKSGRFVRGSRAAKDENGKRIKIPADMNYNDWKKVYIDKTQTLADWRKAKDAEDKILREKDKNSKIRVEGREIIRKLANGENVTPRDLRSKGGRNVKMNENANDIETYRKKTEKLTFKPVTEEQYNKLIIPLKKMGVTIMRGGEKVENHLDLQNAQASNLGKDIVLFREKISMSAILEETYHIIQNRNGLNDDKDTTLRSILNEIDAKKHLLEIASNYGIPREEIAETELQLKQYEKELQAYYAERGEDNV